MKWKLEQLYPGVYHLNFANRYDLCMHFLRYQEYYEGEEHRGKIFTIFDYMEWYAKSSSTHKTRKGKKTQVFTYPGDWSGFNVPSYVFEALNPSTIPDGNRYDAFMRQIALLAMGLEKTGRWYLIGTSSDLGSPSGLTTKDILAHEIAHGFYYTNHQYRDAVQELYEKIPAGVRSKLQDWLLERTYCQEVVLDETHAYLATGLPDKLKKDEACKKARRPFIREFRRLKKALDES